MDNKQLCLSNFLEVASERISHAGDDNDKYRFEDKLYLVLTWEEVYQRFSEYVEENLWQIPINIMQPYLEVHGDVDLDEFSDALDEAMVELEDRSHPLILAHLPDFTGFVNALIEKEYHKDLGDFFAYDQKQHYSSTFHYYIYRVEK